MANKPNEMNMGQHVIEIRKRLMWSAGFIFLTTVLAFVFHTQILTLLMEPAQGFANVPAGKPVYLDLTEFIGIAMKASLTVGIAASLPFVLFQFVLFLAPGLKPNERRYLYVLLPVSLIVFVIGAAFGYRIIFPPAVHFLLNFGSEIATPMPRIGSYVNLMLSLLFWMGIVFETPVVLFFLARIGIVSPEWLARRRKYAVVIAFVLGALITPTFDPINQTLVAVPIIILFELGIWLSKLGRSLRNRASESSDIL
ncbi:MAG: sec-independent protein translocase protein TatC [Chloroflexi bacterium]|nr:MAG: sec-independent protein translocase protein TatC [Chloroflexota bacterium]